MGSQKLAKGGNKFIWNPLAFCIFTLKRDKTYSKTLKGNDFQFQNTKKCSIQKIFEHFIFFFPLIKNHQWLGRRKRQPFLCKRAIIAMASNLKPPWFKVYHCIFYVFFVFSFFSVYYMYQLPWNKSQWWQNPCICDIVHKPLWNCPSSTKIEQRKD